MNYLFDTLIKTKQNKILCLAKNYLKHAIEMGAKEIPPYPVVFGKPWTTLIYEPNSIKIKTNEGHNIDHEGNMLIIQSN
jgi:2-keto-4-pentenoate hydratase/2-oxohepta-3-ene-1,7-dioic acid hydratase in catechol pathway